ncbi:hypothetical protein [Geodermatophilus sp. URMC 64]
MSDDQPPQRRGIADRLLGAAAEPPATEPRREPAEEAPRSLRWAAVVVGVEALAVAAVAGWLLFLTVTSNPADTGRALAEVVFTALGAAALGFAARGLWRVASWARGPVVALQIFLALFGYTSAFTYERPLIGLPVLGLVAVELYLLATPESRLAFFRRAG